MRSAVSIPMVKEERGALAGSRPQSRHSGWPSRFPIKSWSAAERAARAAPFFGTTRANRDEAEPVAAFEHPHHRRRGDALPQPRGPLRHVLRLEREAAQRVALERVEPGGYEE